MDYACVPMMDPNFKYGTCADPWARPGHDSLGFDKGRINPIHNHAQSALSCSSTSLLPSPMAFTFFTAPTREAMDNIEFYVDPRSQGLPTAKKTPSLPGKKHVSSLHGKKSL